MRINQGVRCKVRDDLTTNIIFDMREVGNWAVVREFIFVQGRFLEEK